MSDSHDWQATIVFVAWLVFIMFLLGVATASWLELRKTKRTAAQDEAVRQLINRYEQLAANSLDAQQRVAADLSDLRTRTTSIEQILRTVE